jgi:putative spermidine/putrescine transport system substrate-binding protein
MKKRMDQKRRIGFLAGCLLSAVLVCGCGMTENRADLNAVSLDELIKTAQAQGTVSTLAMPDTWANFGQNWKGLEEKYGITHSDKDMTSSNVLAVFSDAEALDPPDLADVGSVYGYIAEENNLTVKYKTSYWDEIPAGAKDDDGDWLFLYYGTMAFLVNTQLVPEAPQSFGELLAGDYPVGIDEVADDTEGQYAVLAAAFALGGDETDLMPGLTFYKTLHDQGRLVESKDMPGDMAAGKIAVAVTWDYNALNFRDAQAAAGSPVTYTAAIPQDGTAQSGYVSIINRKGAHTEAAALAREYFLSDEGQLNLARGYAMPIRDIAIPEDIQAKRIPASQYAAARRVTNQDVWWEESASQLDDLWTLNVMGQ